MSASDLTGFNSTGITLTATGADTSPFTITSSGNIATAAHYGVYSKISAPVLVNDGSIEASELGVAFLDGGTVLNAGTVFSGALDAIYIRYGGAVTNTAQILGEIQIAKDAGTVANSGQILAGNDFFGVLMENGGAVTNSGAGSVITGDGTGVFITTGSGSVMNDGTISAAAIEGVGLNDGGSVVNAGPASVIIGQLEGVQISAATGFVANDGTIAATGALGVDLSAGGYITNAGTILGSAYGAGASGGLGTVVNTGTISGGTADGVKLEAGGTLINNGVISGGKAAVYLGGIGTQNRLYAGPDAVFNGKVIGAATATNYLALENGSGLLYGIGTTITGFSSLDFQAGASWTVNGTAAGLETVAISGFTTQDVLVVTGAPLLSPEVLTLAAGGALALPGGAVLNLNNAPGTVFTDNTDVYGDQIITEGVACFASGTAIMTGNGRVAVEQLRIGDRVKTMHGGWSPIKWIGTRSYEGRFIAGNHRALPVCIHRDAMAPARDLMVSPDHAICEGGVLIHAWRLVNGVSITQAETVERITYFHVELARHDVMFAEGCAVESFLDEGARGRFANAAEYAALYPGAAPVSAPCLPRVTHGFALARVRDRLAARAGIAPPAGLGALRGFVDAAGPAVVRGWAQDISAPEAPVCLEVFAGNARIGLVLANFYRPDLRDSGLGSGCHGFELAVPAWATGRLSVRRAADGASIRDGAAAKVA
jgi:hypothetical protein